MPKLVRQVKDGVLLSVRVVPRSARNEIVGTQGDSLRVRLNAPPVGGAANAALVVLIADSLRLRKRDVEITSGETSRQKTLHLVGLSEEEVLRRLDTLLSPSEPRRGGMEYPRDGVPSGQKRAVTTCQVQSRVRRA